MISGKAIDLSGRHNLTTVDVYRVPKPVLIPALEQSHIHTDVPRINAGIILYVNIELC